jgi:hypothetical protein
LVPLKKRLGNILNGEKTKKLKKRVIFLFLLQMQKFHMGLIRTGAMETDAMHVINVII